MKFVQTIAVLCVLLFSAFTASAQEKINIVKIGGNLVGLFNDNDSENYWGGALSLEHQLRRRTSLVFGVAFNTDKSTASDGTITLTARESILTFEPEFRFYTKAVTEGFYLGISPALRVLKVKISGAVNLEDSSTRVSMGLTTGYQLNLGKAVHLQIGGGFGMILPDDDNDPTGLYNLNLLVGYQF